MKKILTIIYLSILFPVSVTFNVDMQEQFLSDYGVHLAGSDAETETFFGSIDGVEISPWIPEEIIMNDDDYNGVYSITVDLAPNTSYIYKFINGFDYELQDGEDRILETTDQDIILDAACFNKTDESCTEIDNSLVEVVFTVDMQQVDLSENGIYILGANEDFSNFGFNIETGEPIPPYDPTTTALSEIDDGVYQTSIHLEPGKNYQYKFINGNDWDGVELTDRSIIVSEVLGFNINEVCYNSEVDCPEFTTSIDQLIFKPDLSNAIFGNGFEFGDTLIVRWGFGETQAVEQQDTLSLLAFSYNYKTIIEDVMISEERGLYYQYYKLVDAQDSREIFFNFDYDDDDVVLAERRYFSFEGIEDFSEVSIIDNIDSNVDQRRMPVFLNTDNIGQEVEVTWTIDLSPAYYQILSGDILYDIQGINNVDNVDSLYAWGVWINGPASYPANGENWTQWGSTLFNTNSKKMWDDGTHGDVEAGDSIYTIKLTYDESAKIGQECKFGIKGGDNESSYGLNHYENVNIENPNIHIYWGSINPVFYSAWDYDLNEPIESCTVMDMNSDGIINVIDIVSIVSIILNTNPPSDEELCLADINQDGIVNVIDIVSVVSAILEKI